MESCAGAAGRNRQGNEKENPRTDIHRLEFPRGKAAGHRIKENLSR